ncbi:DnaD domain-containing protein [Bacillus paranthracis]|uniref:DnaD domain-containing protein n=1 Tax=Bacillus cereus group TaxID=86661 RepID=UPI00065B61EE|nr:MULTISPECIES: DnaD domain protein [Bacillus cereus group]KMP79606.1 replication protein [Bacillus cereus]HDR3523884.1 DnaD domain protein [Bacillus pacificus]MDA2195648.1 DnaD domain protein [Bacillus cereus group sp. Bc238]MDA2201182.1 DnaD domain protein [Bacillus cereus group sp. Bc237]WCA19234.1 DnaD domain protein [Bacillus paranthracis]
MATFRVNKDKNYTTINNTGLKDTRLSWKAKGILAYILTLPDDWIFYMEEVTKHSKDGIASLKAGMKELKECGYVKRFPIKGEDGKISKWETIIYEVPQVEKPLVENQLVEKPSVENLPVENQPLLNTKELSTNKQNTNIQSSSSIFSFYENNFGILNSFIAESISQWVNDTSEELVQAAMERALKQQKKWNYAEGILKQWVNNNVKTLKDVDALETEYQRNKGVKKRVGINRKSDDSDSEYIGL